ncbi:hypothetical protein TanjilG_08756 [Lupinus angustifolius]|uniref:Uncharacterized protein n=1 Tax=Lupinus angustifolius TaxID=3871 RepID=A0A4P1QQ68_LUPAN|nr:PREDICTED: uncharacterized protein LOC109334218 isoform X2 [Lupinus angustifolius]OIV92083.1 hypothetical protein TanjilG_08756 [Lupinus angustifolius]
MDPPPGFENGWGPLFLPSNLIYMSISQLVSELRDSFLPTDFDRVEEALVAREAKLMVENEQKKREIGNLQEKIELERLRRVKAEIGNEKRVQEKFGEVSVKQEKCKVDDSDVVVVSELRKRICELESEKKKWVGDSYTIAKLVAENGRLVKEKREAEALVESWKRNFDALNEQLLNGNGNGNGGGGSNEEKRMMEIDVGSEPLKRNGDDCFSTRKSTSKARKDGPRASGGRLGIRMDIDTKDSDKKTCESKDKQEINAHLRSTAVQQKNLPTRLAEPDETLKRKFPSLHEYGRKINFNLLGQLDDIDSDASSSSSDSSCSLDMSSLPLSSLTTIKKKRTEIVLD